MKPRLFQIHKGLLFSTFALCAAALIVISSASTVLSYQRFGYNTYYLQRQAISVGIGLVLMLLLSRFDYRWFKKYSPLLMLIALISLALVLSSALGVQFGNARRWLGVGILYFQPSEFAKLAVIFYLAAWIDSRHEAMESFWSGLLGPLTVIVSAAVLIIVEPDFGSMTALVGIAAALLFAGGARLRHLLLLTLAGLALGWVAVQAAPYRVERVMTFLHPSADPLGAGYQSNQAVLAVGSGGLWGYGYGQSRQKFNFLPEPIGDSVFAVTAEELGFVRVLLILLLYAFFVYSGFSVARNAPDLFGKLVATGITMWVVVQSALNIGAMLQLFPLTGVPLPFLSYGGSAIIALLVGVGVMLNISRFRV